MIEKTNETKTDIADHILKLTQENLSRYCGVVIDDQMFSKLVSNISEALLTRSQTEWTFWKAIDFTIISLTTIGKIVKCK